MFYSEAILSRRGPLAKVWLAAHMERKLSKTQTLQTDIEQSVDAIMGQEVEVMALRLSGQLLLGVVRIYSRKAKYLLDDCNEALLKIKMAFRPGLVDMTEEQLAVNENAITLQINNLDLDALLPDINWVMDFEDRPVHRGGQHIARAADITLATTDDFQFGLDDPGYGMDLGPSDGIGSQDFFDLGIDFGDGPVEAEARIPSEVEDDNISAVEQGRDAAPQRGARDSLASHLIGRTDAEGDFDMLSYRSRERSEHPFNVDNDLDFGPEMGAIDLGIDFGDSRMSEHPPTPHLTPSRASSPLTEPPQTPPPDVEITPIVDVQEVKKRKAKDKKQIIDSVTELRDGPGARVGRGRNAGLGSQMTRDASDIVTENHYLPRSSLVMRLLEIREDPVSHFLPTRVLPNGTFFCAAPPGLAPELTEMFMRPLQSLSGPKRRGESPDKGSNKRQRLESSVAGDDEIEQARRAASAAPSAILGSEILGRRSTGPGMDDTGIEFSGYAGPMEEFQMPEFDVGTGAADVELPTREKSIALSALSRLSTPPPDAPMLEGGEGSGNVECPIVAFDDRSSTQQSSQAGDVAPSDDSKGYSRNTVKALGVIRRELQPSGDNEEEKIMSFRQMSQGATRRAASSFFFELLVLGTRDCVKLSQEAPFENIEIRAKDRLWERQRHGSIAPSMASVLRQESMAPSVASTRRQGSVAPSIGSVLGL